MNTILYLASTSASRKMLLSAAGIPFECIGMNADEAQCDWGLPLAPLVESIAVHKMAHVQLPSGTDGQEIFLLTADTLSQDSTGKITGKPSSREDAVTMIRAARNGMRTCTAFCIERKKYTAGAWHTQQKIVQHVTAEYEFDVPEAWLAWYLDTSRGQNCSGAIAIEEHGGLFLRGVQGSYTTIIGLPLCQLRMALEEIGFFSLS